MLVRQRLSTFSFQECFIYGSKCSVSLIDDEEQIIVVAVAINRHGLSRAGANQVVDVSAGSNLAIDLRLNVGGPASHIFHLNVVAVKASRVVEFSVRRGQTAKVVHLACSGSNTSRVFGSSCWGTSL